MSEIRADHIEAPDMSRDPISRQAAIDAVDAIGHIATMPDGDKCVRRSAVKYTLSMLPSAQPENQVHLCDSCRHVYPECPSKKEDVIFGNGKGNDNICACNKYEPSAQPEQKIGHWIAPKYYPTQFTYTCSKCGYKQSFNGKFKFCPNCGADMRGENE